ncbi:uncharacterized protein LOC134220952 isoform X1 [Armigeres subalbatus]|uniref:uncharacterized protein LOC134220952 isoform X1 n=1 Tax=Armigeres subalbatus TaxID=124917 RepID=UPI002ED029B9
MLIISAKIESLRLMIPILEAEQMTNAFRSPLTTPPLYACSSDYVYGNLMFPCVNLEHLENLESAVRESGTVREQYVNYLRASRYECQHEIERVLNRMFEDKAFMGYPYTTGSHANASIKSLGLNLASYEIFNSCMLDAWPDLNKNTLYEKISAFFGTTCTNGGMLEKKEMMNKTNSILEVEQCNEAVLDSTFTSPPFGYSSDYEYDCLVFPFNNSKQLALLEDNVKGSVDVREQYINYLRASRFECKNDLEKVLRRMFDEEAFMGYCYTWFPRPTSRPNLLSYCIFNDCMLDAWSDMTHDSLTDALSKLIPKMRKSAYRREYKALKSTHK